jgi:hypothetical protein
MDAVRPSEDLWGLPNMTPESLKPSDRVTIAWILLDGGAVEKDVWTFVKVLEEGVRRGEDDSIQALHAFRRQGVEAGEGLLANIARIMDVGADLTSTRERMLRHAAFLRSVSTADAPDDVGARIAIRKLAEVSGTLS